MAPRLQHAFRRLLRNLLIGAAVATTAWEPGAFAGTSQVARDAALSSPAAGARPIVNVGDMASLYAAVNAIANQGARVVLAPGLYLLDPSYPNAGRLELQPDMALQGAPGNPSRVVIDASALPASSYAVPPITTGAIRTGRGSNAIEWLTVRGATAGASAIATDLIATKYAQVRIAHVLARDSTRGVDVRNIGAASAGRMLEVDLADNEFADHVLGAGQGLRFLNIDAPGATIAATLRRNHSHRNIAGCIAANIDTVGARIAIRSWADRFEGNGNGCVLLGGQGRAGPATPATGNLLTMEAHASSFQDNTGPLPAAFPIPGGILAVGGQSIGAGHRAFGNAVEIELWGVRMGNNDGPDINAFGALTSASAPAGTDNAALISLHGMPKVEAIAQTPSLPPEPAGTNTVEIIR